MTIALETGRCANPATCRMPYLSIVYQKGEHRFGQMLRGCGGPYHAEREVPARALRSLQEAKTHGLPIDRPRLLADLQRDAQAAIARLIQDGSIERSEGEAFLDEVFP